MPIGRRLEQLDGAAARGSRRRAPAAPFAVTVDRVGRRVDVAGREAALDRQQVLRLALRVEHEEVVLARVEVDRDDVVAEAGVEVVTVRTPERTCVPSIVIVSAPEPVQ